MSTMQLFELAPAYSQAMEIFEQMTADGCSQDELDEAMQIIEKIGGDLNEKALNIASWVKNLEAEAKAIKEAEQSMAKRRQSATNRAERLKAFLLSGMKVAGVQKMQFPQFCVAIRQNPESVKIADGAAIPESLLRFVEPEPDKAAIKAALKSGEIIPGCILERGEKLEIK